MKLIPTFKPTKRILLNAIFQSETPPMTYLDLVTIFGEPQYKHELDPEGPCITTARWNIEFSDRTIASIYDYKMTALYDAEHPLPVRFRRMKTRWHIAGNLEFHMGHAKMRASQLVLATICLNWSFEKIMDVVEDLEENPNQLVEYGITTCITAEKMIEAARLAGKKL